MDNRNGAHVCVTRIVSVSGQSHMEDGVLSYGEVLGPLRQSAVIEASGIHFRWWPADFVGVFGGTDRCVVLVTEGAVNIESDAGVLRAFYPGDVLEIATDDAEGQRIRAADGRPFRAAVVHLERTALNAEQNMREKSEQSLTYVRNVSGDDGQSHFQHGSLAYYREDGGALATDNIAITRFQYVFAAGDLHYDFHNAPQRQIVIPLTGGIRGENGDGTQREIPPGGVYFGEDTTGQGHITRALNDEIRFSIFAHLA